MILSMSEIGETEEFIFEDNRPTAENNESPLDYKITRRGLVKGAAKYGIAAAIGAKIGLELSEHKNRKSEENTQFVEESTDQMNILQQEQRETAQTELLKQQMNEILGLELFSDVRNTVEQTYAESVQTLEGVDMALSVCADMDVRTYLINKRWELRQRGTPGMTQLTEDQLKFCYSRDITPEVLGMCLDAYKDAKRIIGKLKGELRPDLPEIEAEMLMINPGGMAELIMQETSGFKTIGSKKAMTQLTSEIDQESLVQLCALLSKDTGLQFDPHNVPGSDIGDPNVNWSGGAIGIQFMPGNALRYYRMFQEVGEEANIFDPLQSIKMAWAFVAHHERVGPEPNAIRWGYVKGDNTAIELAIRKWNNLDSEVNAIMGSAYQYYDEVVSRQRE